MKKSLLALAVFGAFAGVAHAQSSVTIYGIIDTAVAYTNKVQTSGTATGSKFSVNSGTLQGSRLGFKGTEDLGGGLSAVFALEAGFSSDTGALNSANAGTTTLFRRKSYVGFGSGFGTVLVGRQTDWNDTISAYTSVNDFGGVTGAVGHNIDRLEGTRTNNSISYTTTSLNGFTAQALYGFGETAGSTSSGQAFGLGGQYLNGPLALGASYYQSKVGASTSTTADSSLLGSSASTYSSTLAGSTAQKVFTLVGSYQVGPARIYGNWSQVKQPLNTSTVSGLTTSNVTTTGSLALAKKVNVYELGTAYSLSAALKLLAAVDYTTAQFDGINNKGKLTQFTLGTDYALSQRTDIYSYIGDLKAKNMTNPGINDATGSDNSQIFVTVGVRHKF
jgi:predicted porin